MDKWNKYNLMKGRAVNKYYLMEGRQVEQVLSEKGKTCGTHIV